MWVLNTKLLFFGHRWFSGEKRRVEFEPRTLVEKSESHVVIGFFLRLFLLFFFGSLLSSGSSWSSTTCTCSRGGTDSRSNVGDEILDVDGLEALGKKTRPERLHGDVGGLQDGRDLLGGDGNIIVGEDQGGIDTS